MFIVTAQLTFFDTTRDDAIVPRKGGTISRFSVGLRWYGVVISQVEGRKKDRLRGGVIFVLVCGPVVCIG